MQRRLIEEGSTFQDLLEEARREMARHYLRQPSLELNETAYLLGYEDPNSFIRLFTNGKGRRRATGDPPIPPQFSKRPVLRKNTLNEDHDRSATCMQKMKMRRLGNSNLYVSAIGYGAMGMTSVHYGPAGERNDQIALLRARS